MIYDPAEHPFSETHKLMIGSIVPRPIALVSTTSNNGINNLAPFSYFNGVCSKPPTIMFAPARRGWDGKEKDTLKNINGGGFPYVTSDLPIAKVSQKCTPNKKIENSQNQKFNILISKLQKKLP